MLRRSGHIPGKPRLNTRNRIYNHPDHFHLKLVEAVLWFLVIIVWWDEANSRDEIFGIGIMIFLAIYGAKDVYDAVKLLIMNKNR